MSRQLLSESVVSVEILHHEYPTVLQESPVRVLKVRASENPQYGRIYALEPSKHALELPIRSEKYALKVRSGGENTP